MRSAQPALKQPVAGLAGVGPRLSEKLARIGVATLGDVLCLLPLRYEDRTQVRPLGSLRPGEKVLIEGEIELSEVAFRRRRSLLVRLSDRTGTLTLRFFHFSNAQHAGLGRGVRLRCFGEVRAGPTGLEMVHPEYQALTDDGAAVQTTLTPVYPSTEGLHQQRLRRLVDQVLERLDGDPLPDLIGDLLTAEGPSIDEALAFLHRPPRGTDIAALVGGRHACQRRVALEELVAHRLSLRKTAGEHEGEHAFAMPSEHEALHRLRGGLAFALTAGQEGALEEILADMAEPRPMHRLLQGDVGSGKTVVAAFAAVLAAASGHQAAFMAPTELLAEQHLATFTAWLEPLGIVVVGLSGSLGAAVRARTLEAVATGAADVVIGTHALFQEAVHFARLALVIVDEQHRFGVHQRLSLRKKGERDERSPHQLIMTATPIPRTLAMTAYADLDCSVIDGLPAGRQPVKTVVMPERRRGELVARMAAHCAGGQQAYWVCPLIEESELIESSAALELERELADALPELGIAAIHGRMKPADKERVMAEFKNGAIDVLVATTVIEVGVDVPNATLMVVENSERMGLAQLHQLRGRVGRGRDASSCVLLYKPPLNSLARERLDVLRSTNDGFKVAEKDLELRGPGEVLGTRQTGVLDLRVADLARDADLLPEVIRVSEVLIERHPERIEPLLARWIRAGVEYAKV
jgi:ATP-dependent DNA helicase RecG